MGFSSTLLTAVFLSIVELKYELALYSYTFFFIIPVGAFCSGMAAASGYLGGARLFHQKPIGGVLFNMVSASIAAFFLVHYIPYSLLEIDGIPISRVLSFWEYLDISIRATSMKFVRGKASTGELGSWGYVVAFVQLAGFALGGLGVWAYLTEFPYCEKCRRYLSKVEGHQRFSSDAEATAEAFSQLVVLVVGKQFAEATEHYCKNMGASEWDAKAQLSSSLVIRECPSCGVNHFSFVMAKWNGRDWSDIRETEIREFTKERLRVGGAAGSR